MPNKKYCKFKSEVIYDINSYERQMSLIIYVKGTDFSYHPMILYDENKTSFTYTWQLYLHGKKVRNLDNFTLDIKQRIKKYYLDELSDVIEFKILKHKCS